VIRTAIAGGSGYAGGELLRLLLQHPQVEVTAVTSRRYSGQYVHQVHPNLRRLTQLQFVAQEELGQVDVLFLALPHGEAQQRIQQDSARAERIIDLSADFRLRDADDYQRWYAVPHRAPEWLSRFVYGLPELNRQAIQQARYVSGVGCNATAGILALLPLVRASVLGDNLRIVVEIKVGSSEAGADPQSGSHHPERSGVIRTFSPMGHRHTAEVIQALELPQVVLTITSVDIVRGVLATAHAETLPGTTTKDLWQGYRELVRENPFLRLVKEARGIHRVPDPKVLAGSNFADLGFDLDEETGHIVSMCAIDNLMKGAAGTAVQCMNLMHGWEETTGLTFPGLHPV
jgi:N-acetyl-gamma-glutamyl-phosphate/LysW-gamma-L-alpha-aminoadipyl-6-phosphate reductase